MITKKLGTEICQNAKICFVTKKCFIQVNLCYSAVFMTTGDWNEELFLLMFFTKRMEVVSFGEIFNFLNFE